MKIATSDSRDDPLPDSQLTTLTEQLNAVSAALNLPPGNVEVTLIDDTVIRNLNREHRNIDAPTNVLAFPHFNWIKPGVCVEPMPGIDQADAPILLGEVLVSMDTVKRDAEAAGVPLSDELVRIIVHGLLHIIGYDHETDMDYDEMAEREVAAMQIYTTMKEV